MAHDITAEFEDSSTGWRLVLCYMQRPSVRRRIKRATSKRERRAAKAMILEDQS